MARASVLMTVPMLPELLDCLEQRFKVYRLWEISDEPSFLCEHGAEIRAVVGNGAKGASRELIDALPNLEIISTFSVGLDKIDVQRCRERGIAVTNTPDVLTDDVADLAILLLLAASRRLCPADHYVRAGRWTSQGDISLAQKASGKRVGILGLGRIGLAIARRAEAFGCSISYCGRSPKPEVPYNFYGSLVELATNSDFLVVACPLTKETQHVVDKEVIDALGPKGTLINIARGPIVNEAELVKALAEGRLGAAGLDVFENEPFVPEELFRMDNVVLTPHIGSATWDTRRAMANLVVGNLDMHFSMKPLLTPVN